MTSTTTTTTSSPSPHPPTLTTHDNLILTYLLSPSSTPSPSLIDPTLPSPHPASILRQESSILLPLARNSPSPSPAEIATAIAALSDLIAQQPSNASVYNNRAQASRLLAGDDLHTRAVAESGVWGDLARAIELVREAGRGREGRVSKVEAGVAAKALVQRAVLLRKYARGLAQPPSETTPSSSPNPNLDDLPSHSAPPPRPKEQQPSPSDQSERSPRWLPLELQGLDHDAVEAFARRDLETAGRYGDEGARDLAVRLNPYAKLCGNVVREAMRGEMGGGVSPGG